MSDYVPFHMESRLKAQALCKGIEDPKAKYLRVIGYVEHNFAYDFIRAIKIPKRNGMPDIAGCWEKRMGICLDVAAMTTGMLRAVGLDARLCIGRVSKTGGMGSAHAWVETDIDGNLYIFDHRKPKRSLHYQTERTYT